MNIAEACVAGDCVEKTIYRAIKSGKIRSTLVNGAHEIDADSFREWNSGRRVTRERADQTKAAYEAIASVYARRRAEALENFARLSDAYLDAYEALGDERPDAREFDSSCEAVLRAAADNFAAVRTLAEEARESYAAAKEAANEAKIIFDVERAEIDAAYNEGLEALKNDAEKVGVDIF
ncbi:MAG: hypothetical protein ACRDJT_09430 [Actinomycetota bacterium]